MRAARWHDQDRGTSGLAFGIAAIAAFVALPTGLPLSEVLVRWVPALHQFQGAPLAVLVTLTIWGVLVAWLLASAMKYTRDTLERPLREAAPGYRHGLDNPPV